jgi:hypothetical protein
MEELSDKENERLAEKIRGFLIAKTLRDDKYLEKLANKEPEVIARSNVSQVDKDAVINRWYADEYGIIIHCPEYLSVYSPGSQYFRKQMQLSDHQNFKRKEKSVETVQIFATEHLIAISITVGNTLTNDIAIYDRKTLLLVLLFRELEPYVHLFTTVYKGKKELILKRHFSDHMLNIIHEDGTLECIMKAFHGCDCRKKPEFKKAAIPEFVCLEGNYLLRYCYICTGGMVVDLTNPGYEDFITSIKPINDPIESCDLEYKEVSSPYVPFYLGKNRPCRQKLSIEWFPESDIVAINGLCPTRDFFTHVDLVNLKTGKVELAMDRYRSKGRRLTHAVSKDFLVISWRNTNDVVNILTGRKEDNLTKMLIKNRKTNTEELFEIPGIIDSIGLMKFLSDSILIAFPAGTSALVLKHERVYTMDLSVEHPEYSVKSFKVPISEVRPLGKDKIICTGLGEVYDEFKIFSLT